jgi:hypothetical protein
MYFNVYIHVELWETKGQENLEREKGKENLAKC